MNDYCKNTLAEKLAQLQAVFVARLQDELAALRTMGEGLRGGERDRGDLNELHERLHKLAGTGGSFGYAELGAAASVLEQKVKNWLSGDLASLDAVVRRSLAEDLSALSVNLADTRPGIEFAAARGEGQAADKVFRIWLVEEDAELGRQLAHQFESFNYVVRLFEGIEQAERATLEDRPDLLIVDVLFEQRGEDATEVLQQSPGLRVPDCPLLFITATDDFPSRVRAARLGAMGYFLKPIDVPRLVSRIMQIIDQLHAPPQRVLIVDDDADLAEHMRLVLMAAGMKAEVLKRPQDIMEEIGTFRPELVLMDLHMPDFSGPDLAGVIRQHDNHANLPIVYLSAETDLEQQIQAMDRGADDFLTKPISDLQLVAATRARIARARQLDEQITRDSLTGLLKHASIKQAVDVEILRARRAGKPVTLVMLDIDHFKAVNDTHGHAQGDVVIAAVATLLRQRLRQSDIVGRYGGEEFVAVLPECDRPNAFLLLEDIRQRFSSLRFNHDGRDFTCTLSAGFACSEEHPESDGAALLVAADEALYVAKRSGRNQVRATNSS